MVDENSIYSGSGGSCDGTTTDQVQTVLPQAPLGNVCPSCGYCPHCGRGNYRPYPPYWPYPFTPWYTVSTSGTSPDTVLTGYIT